MFEKLKKLKHHIIFLLIVIISLSLIFGHSWGNVFAAFTYVSILTPIVISVVYFFNYYLVPRYLITRKYLQFTIYSGLTVAVSLLLESYLVVFSFILLGHFNFYKVAPNASDTVLLFAVLYLFVFVASTILMFKQLSGAHHKINTYAEEQKLKSLSLLEVISNRKKISIQYDTIQYIESLADYIIIHTTSKEIKSNERISAIQKRLPADMFIRIHRSFILNKTHITASNNDYISIGDTDLPIGRSYRPNVKELL